MIRNIAKAVPQKSFKEMESPKEKLFFLIHEALPYIALFFASLIVFYVWIISPYFTGGDDGAVQVSLLYDLYYGLNNGFFDSTNHVYMGIYAMNAGLFYGLFPHYCMVLFTYIFSFLGASLKDGVVAISILSVFLSGLFTYFLALRITKRKLMALAAGIAYIFLPYRIFCFYYRFALSEAVAMAFLPIFFYALYRICHDVEILILPYVILVLSLAATIMSHPFTALITVLGGVIYLLANIRTLILNKRIKDWRFYVYFFGSVLLEIGLVFAFFFPMMEALNTGLYRVSFEKIMWTDVENVIWRISQSIQFAGFLNFPWRNSYQPLGFGDSELMWALGLALFPLLCFLGFTLDQVLKKKLSLPFIQKTIVRIGILAIFLIILPICLSPRIELLFAFILVFSLYILFFLFFEKKETEETTLFQHEEIKEEYRKLLSEPDVYASLFMMVFCLIALFSASFWEIAPSILRMCQFPFRFWGLFGFFTILLLLYLCRPLRKLSWSPILLFTLASYIFVLQQGTVDKRIYTLEQGNGYIQNVDLDFVLSQDHYGHQNEYMPQILWQIVEGGIEPSYPNSFALTIGRDIVYNRDVPYGLEEYIPPIFLEGKGEIIVENIRTPEATFSLLIEENSLIQIPQIYYEGYEAIFIQEGKRTSLDVLNVDGFVAISLPVTGEGILELTYPGPLLRQIGRPISWTSFALSSLLLGYGLYEEKKKVFIKK